MVQAVYARHPSKVSVVFNEALLCEALSEDVLEELVERRLEGRSKR